MVPPHKDAKLQHSNREGKPHLRLRDDQLALYP